MGCVVSLFTIILLFHSLNQVASEEYYIRAYSTDVCAPSCLTLSQFVAESSYLLKSNITLIFNPGRHHLDIGLTVLNLRNISMTSRQTTAEIRCTRYSKITFSHSQDIHITNLEFVGCGGNQVVNVDKFVVRNTTFRGQENSGTALELIKTTAQIVNCIFSSNRNGKIQRFFFKYYSSYVYGQVGSAIFIANHSNVNISQSIFENNGASYYLHYGAAIFAEQQSTININASKFINNSAPFGILYSNSCSIRIEASEFRNNSVLHIILSVEYTTLVDFSGVLVLNGGSIATVEQSLFEDNSGSALSSGSSNITIKTSKFYDNFVEHGVLYTEHCNVTIQDIKLYNNSGGSMFIRDSNCSIDMSEFERNLGQAVLAIFSKVVISSCQFDNNTEFMPSLPVLSCAGSTVILINNNFTHNKASIIGAVTSRIEYYESLLIANNSAESGVAIIYLDTSQFIGHDSGNATISNNIRPLVALSSNITLMGNVRFLNNHIPQSITNSYMQEGGAITLVQSNAYLDGSCTFERNHADNGGAILSIDSKIYASGNVTIAHNVANRNGGGVYLIDSDLNCLNVSIFTLLHITLLHIKGEESMPSAHPSRLRHC